MLRFPYLETLDVSGNHLTGEIRKELRNLSKLHTLDLSANGLTGDIPIELERLPNLSSLSVSFNHLSGPCLQIVFTEEEACP